MKANRPPFAPLDGDLDSKLTQLAREKGVGAMVRPNAEEKRDELPAPAADPDKPARAAPAPPPRSRMKTVNLELPDYVWTDLKIRALANKQASATS